MFASLAIVCSYVLVVASRFLRLVLRASDSMGAVYVWLSVLQVRVLGMHTQEL